ncbi:MAG: hypothetical protein U0R70_14730 [Solirubrobacteraceae bacterium]
MNPPPGTLAPSPTATTASGSHGIDEKRPAELADPDAPASVTYSSSAPVAKVGDHAVWLDSPLDFDAGHKALSGLEPSLDDDGYLPAGGGPFGV